MKWPTSDKPEGKGAQQQQPTLYERYSAGPLFLPCLALFGAGSALALGYLYRNYVRRILTASHIQPHFLRRRSLLGRVTSVGDGDNFRLFHTPGGRLMGWGWFPGRRIPNTRKALKDQTIHVRIAGIDAPEGAHFGRTPQPYSAEALHWLKNYVGGRRVRVYVYSKDQYDRVVASAKVRKGLFRRDVGLQMLKAGMATLYEAKFGAEFGSLQTKYEEAEAKAKKARVGLWRQPARLRISPHEYKKALRVKSGNE